MWVFATNTGTSVLQLDKSWQWGQAGAEYAESEHTAQTPPSSFPQALGCLPLTTLVSMPLLLKLDGGFGP